MSKSGTLARGRLDGQAVNAGKGEHSLPVRTCIGCRDKALKSQLVRVVASGQPPQLSLDAESRLPGRGAWLHPELSCFDLALKKVAFGRALRIPRLQDAVALRQDFIDLVEPVS